MGASDRTGAGWVLMALAVGAGWWYWQLGPGERRKVLGAAGLEGGASGGAGATGATGATGGAAEGPADPHKLGTIEPRPGPAGQDEIDRAPEWVKKLRRALEKAQQKRAGYTPGINPEPFDAGARLLGLWA